MAAILVTSGEIQAGSLFAPLSTPQRSAYALLRVDLGLIGTPSVAIVKRHEGTWGVSQIRDPPNEYKLRVTDPPPNWIDIV